MEYKTYIITSSEDSLLKERLSIYNKLLKKELIAEKQFTEYLHFTEPVRFILSKSNNCEGPIIHIARKEETFSNEYFENTIVDFIIDYNELPLNKYPTLMDIDEVLYNLKNFMNNPKIVCDIDVLKEPTLTEFQVIFTINNSLEFSIHIDIDRKLYYLSRAYSKESATCSFDEEQIVEMEKFIFSKLLSKVC